MNISVIVPVYKVEKYLNRCIDSILNQTYTDFELILVDDGSPDNCGQICDEYAEKDSRIIVIHKENGGLSDARNAGIDWAFANSNSEWLTFIDSDDWVHPKYLEVLFETANHYNSDISVCAYSVAENENPFCSISAFDISNERVESFYIEYHTTATVAWGKLYRKFLFNNIRYPFGKLNEDEFITYIFLFKYNRVVYINNPLYFYYKNTEGIINSRWNFSKLDCIDAFKQQIEFFENKKQNLALAYAQRLLILAYADAIYNIRVFYPKRILLRVKYVLALYYSKCFFSKKYLTEKDKKVINLSLYPKLNRVVRFAKTKVRHLNEIISRGIKH